MSEEIKVKLLKPLIDVTAEEKGTEEINELIFKEPTIGDFINDSTGSTMGQPCYLSNVSITIGNEYIWDINQNDAKSITSFEVPMYMKIAIEAKLIGDFTPSSTTNYFGTKNSNLDWLT